MSDKNIMEVLPETLKHAILELLLPRLDVAPLIDLLHWMHIKGRREGRDQIRQEIRGALGI